MLVRLHPRYTGGAAKGIDKLSTGITMNNSNDLDLLKAVLQLDGHQMTETPKGKKIIMRLIIKFLGSLSLK